MSARDDRRQQLDAEVRRAHRLAGQKVSRLERHGVRVRKAELDPRVSQSELASMNGVQKRSYLNRLQKFNSRQMGWVAGRAGTPIDAAKWRTYERLQKKNNKAAEAREEEVGHIELPEQNQTVLERFETLSQSSKSGVTNRILHKIERTSDMIKSTRALDKLIKDMRKKTDPEYFEKTTRKRMNSIYAILKHSDYKDLIDVLKDMSVEQQNFLMDYSNFVGIAKERFYPESKVVKDMDRDYELRNGVSKEHDTREALQQTIDWVIENSVTTRNADSQPTTNEEQAGPAQPGGPAKPRQRAGSTKTVRIGQGFKRLFGK